MKKYINLFKYFTPFLFISLFFLGGPGFVSANTGMSPLVWTAPTAPSGYWGSVTYGNGLFVAVGTGIMTSPDGINWTARTVAGTNSWSSVTYGNGLFVAVGLSGTNRVMTSPDGINWTLRTSALETNQWRAVTYGNGLFVAVGTAAMNERTDKVMTSPDGINWTLRTAINSTWASITYGIPSYGVGCFIAVGDAGIMSSLDGINWTMTYKIGLGSVAYGNGRFVAISNFFYSRNGASALTSTDGVNWSGTYGSQWPGGVIAYGNGLFVTAGASTYTSNGALTNPTSVDGLNWTLGSPSVPSTSYTSVAYGNGLFVAVGFNPFVIITAPYLPNLTASASTPNTATVGEAQTFSSTITNNGAVSTGTSFYNFFQVASAANGGGTVIDKTAALMSVLASSGTGVASVNHTFSSSGAYSVRACADKSSSSNSGTINESNETDNCSPWTNVTVTIGNLKPNLTITNTWGISNGAQSGITYGGAPYTLSWDNVVNAISCTLNGSSVARAGGNLSGVASGFTNNTKDFTLSCVGPEESTGSSTATISYPPPPTEITSSCSDDGTVGTFSWSLPSLYDTFYTRAGLGDADLDAPAWDDNFTGTSKTFTTIPGNDYSVWVHTKDVSNGAWSEPIYSWFSCPTNSSILIVTTSPFTDITSTSAVGGGNISWNGGSTILVSGLVWSTTADPTVDNNVGITYDGWADPGSWSSEMVGLTPGTLYYVRAYATNSAGTAYGTNETFSTTAFPDLVASAPSPVNATVSTAVTFSSVIQNIGDISTGDSFYNIFQVKPEGGLPEDLSRNSMDALSAGGSDTTHQTYTFASAGTYLMRACADKSSAEDATGLIAESKEDNNCGDWTQVVVNGPNLPDLTVSSDITPTAVLTNVPTDFSVTISNTGTQDVSAFFQNIFQEASLPNGGGTIQAIGNVPIDSLNAGGSRQIGFSYTFPTIGTYSMQVCTNEIPERGGSPVIAESREDNNCGSWININVTSSVCQDPNARNNGKAIPCITGTGTCFDGVQNGDEKGTDCGGNYCTKSCKKIPWWQEL